MTLPAIAVLDNTVIMLNGISLSRLRRIGALVLPIILGVACGRLLVAFSVSTTMSNRASGAVAGACHQVPLGGNSSEPLKEHELPVGNGRQYRARVVGVHDGDTLTGLDENNTQFKIRLDAIDAPELGQPYGQASKKALSEKVFGKTVAVVPKKKDRWARTVAHVMIDGRDVNLEMLEEGMAWHYKLFDKNKRLAQAEQSARDGRKGLWQDRDPVPPWEWRKGGGKGR